MDGGDRYISINITYDQAIWNEIIERYIPKAGPVRMAESPTVAGMFDANSKYRDGLD